MNKRTIEDIYELSPMQSGMLFHTLLEPASRLYFEQIVLPFDGQISEQIFTQAWLSVAAAHPVLRTSIHQADLDKAVQVVHREATIPIEIWDLRHVTPADREHEFKQKLSADRTLGFELDRPPLIRAALTHITDDSHRLVLSFHHIILDGWSLQSVFNQFLDAYARLAMGQRVFLAKTRPYRSYIEWLQSKDNDAAKNYWTRTLAGVGGPTGIAGVAQLAVSQEGTTPDDFTEHEIHLSTQATEALRQAGLSQRLTLNTLLQGAWALLLNRYSGHDDIVFGVTVSGRPAELADVEQMVGLFINTVPLRVQVAANDEVSDWLTALQTKQFEARQFDHCALVQIAQWAGIPGAQSLFDTILAFENYPVKQTQGEQSAETTFIERTNYPLSAAVIPRNGLQIRLLYNRRLIPQSTVEAMADTLIRILKSLTEGLAKPTTLSNLAQTDTVQGLNTPDTAYPRKSIPELFEEFVLATPHAIAVETCRRSLTYAKLNAQANHLASRLTELGVKRSDHVALMLDTTDELATAMLAVLKTGAAYVPLDSAYPGSRINAILQNTDARLVLCCVAHAPLFEHSEQVVVDVATEVAASPDRSAVIQLVRTTTEDVAYVMYTSGSTGEPKGIRVPHRAVVRLVRSTNYIELKSGDRIASHSNSAFDAATFEIWGALLNGATAVELEREIVLSPPALSTFLQDQKITTMFLTTALFNRTVKERAGVFSPLQSLLFGGEAVDAGAVRAVLASAPPKRLLHMYGPTECTTFATWHHVENLEPASANVAIGKAVANTTAHVLSSQMLPVPPGATGELCLGGDGLAHGYHNLPRLTAERFIPNPFSTRAGARLYRTGDKVRLNVDGTLEFIQRWDTQIKLRGYRIELSEIEQVLRSCAGVNEAVVIARGSGDSHTLLAYVTARQSTDKNWMEGLENELGSRLPAYMKPGHLMLLEELPLTLNGKIDRAALPEPSVATNGSATPVAPRNPTEARLHDIWVAVLERDGIGVHDNFLNIGGHSLRATQLVSRIGRDFGVELPLRTVFEHPTIAGLARIVVELSAGKDNAMAAKPAEKAGGIQRVSRDSHRREIG